MTTNRYALTDGSLSFIIDPDKEDNPAKARSEKRRLLITLNLLSLHQRPWTVEAIRKLCKGIIKITAESNRRLTKTELIDAIAEYTKLEKAVQLVNLEKTLEIVQDYNFEPQDFINLIAKYRDISLVDIEATEIVNRHNSDRDKPQIIFSKDCKDLVNGMENLLIASSSNIRTQVKTYLPIVAKLIKSELDPNISNQVASLLHKKFTEKNVQIRDAYQKDIGSNSRNRREVNWSLLYEMAMDYLTKSEPTWKELSHGLAVTTGRRMSEIHAKTTKFSLVNNSKDELWFEGQAKTKGREDIGAYRIRVFADPQLIIEAHHKLRQLGHGNYEVIEVNQKISKSLSSQLASGIKTRRANAGILKYKDMRDAYTNYLVYLQGSNDPTTVNALISQNLGHREDDLNTANAYQKLRIVGVD